VGGDQFAGVLGPGKVAHLPTEQQLETSSTESQPPSLYLQPPGKKTALKGQSSVILIRFLPL
jgi:hypothetical protein